MVNFGPADSFPAQFRSRNLYQHYPHVTLMRTTSEECAEIGRISAHKLNRACGPMTVLIPLQGVPAIDKSEDPFYSQDALDAWRNPLEAALNPSVRMNELDAHINDDAFARMAAELLMESISAVTETTVD
jgi:uncharacterized protein (UPF0261 family)